MAKHVKIPPSRTVLTALTALAALALAGVLGWSAHTSQQRSQATPPAPGTTIDGVVDGTGPVTVEVWLDLECPDCRELAAEVDATLDELVADELVTRVYHPVPLREEGLRVAASVACAADREAHSGYLSVLLTLPPDPDGAAPTDDELIHLAGASGLIDPAFSQCVRAEYYLGWARQVAARAAADGVASLPTVRVDRADVEMSPAAIVSAVEAAAASRG